MCKDNTILVAPGALCKMDMIAMDEFYSCPVLADELRGNVPVRRIGNVPLKSFSVGRFEYSDGTVASYGEYSYVHNSVAGLIGSGIDVFVFHSSVKPYGKSSVCFAVPPDLSERLKEQRYDTMWVVQLFRYGEEDVGPWYTYQKYMRKAGHNDCIPIPQILAKYVSGGGIWSIGITAVLRDVPPQFDGFVYPYALMIGDLIGLAGFLKVDE